MATNFTDILSKSADAIEKPKPLPVGTYICMIDGPAEFVEVGQNETPAANLKLRPLAADVDVDQGLLAEQGGIGERRIRHTLYLSEDALWRAKEFFENCGIPAEGKTLKELFAALPNQQIKVVIKHQPSKDGTEMYANVARTLAV